MDASPLNLARPEVPVELAALVAKMMAKEPRRRFQEPREVAQALAPFFKPAAPQPSGTSAEASHIGTQVVPIQSSGGDLAPRRPATPATAPAPAERKPPKIGADKVAWESLIELKEDEPFINAVKPAEPKSAHTEGPTRRPPWVWASVAAGLLLLGLIIAWAALVLRVKTKEGVILLENLPEEAVVYVDGGRVNVSWPDGGVFAEIVVPEGKHGVKVKMPGFTTFGEDVVIDAGGRRGIRVRLERPIAERAERVEPPVTNPPDDPPSSTPIDRTRFTKLSGRWHVEGEELVQTDASRWFCALTFGDARWTDCDFTVDAKRVGGDGSFSLLVRNTGINDEFDYVISGDENRTFHAEVHEPGRSQVLKSFDFSLQDHRWYTARVHVRGDRFACFLYDNEAGRDVGRLDVEDARHPRGRVGLQTFGGVFRFKNIKVTSPSGRLLWEGPPAVGPPTSTDRTEATKEAVEPRIRPDHAAPPPPEQGFVSVFNGEDLTGWRMDRGDARTWYVENKTLVGASANDWRKMTFLLSERDYSNFILRFEFQLPKNTDSGVVLRAKPGENHIEVNLRNFDDPPGAHAQTAALRWSTNGRGMDYVPPDRPAGLAPEVAWNEMTIELRGSRLRASVNRREVRDTDLSNWVNKPNALPALRYLSGRIGFQSHSGTVRFRNIEIKELPPGLPNSSSTAAQDHTNATTRKGAPKTPNSRRADSRHPADAREFQGKYYKLFPQQLSWHEASRRCQQMGGRLAVVTNETQNRFLARLVSENGLAAAWLGATDEQIEGRWVWVDGSPMRYSNWDPVGRQPNNKQGLEHYLVLWVSHDGKWSDQPTNSIEISPSFICQWD
jgi:hypothetical protein